MIFLLKYRKEDLSEALKSFLLLALFLSLNIYNNSFDISSEISPPPHKNSFLFNELNKKKQTLNCCRSSDSNIELISARRQDESKQKNLQRICFVISNFISCSPVLLWLFFSEKCLSKPFLNLEILSSRHHPPTFI